MGTRVMRVLIVVFSIVTAVYPCSSETWADEGQKLFPNLVRDGGFETTGEKEGEAAPQDWKVNISTFSDIIKPGYYWESTGHTGEKSLGFTGGEAEPAVVGMEIRGIKPETYYLLEFWAKRDSFQEGVYPETELFDLKKRWDTHLLYGGWQKFFSLNNSGSVTETTYLKFINNFPGKFTLDDISLREFQISLNKPEYDPEKKMVKISWIEPQNDFALRYRVAFSRHLPFSPDKTLETTNSKELSLELSDNLARGDWFWRVEAFQGEEKIAVTEIGWYQGDSFFPIGIYGVPAEELADVKEAGFNIAQNYSSDPDVLGAFIKNAEVLGLKVMIPAPASEEFIGKAKGSPALLAWYLDDEPEGRSIPPKTLLQKKERVRAIDPSHPGALVIVRAWATKNYAPATDILMSDQYPIPNSPLTWLSDSIEEMKQATAGKKPIWSAVQAFMSKEEGWPREPTYQEMRALTFLSLVHEAEGIFYFTYKGSGYYIKNSPEHWENLKKIVAQLNKLKEWLPLSNSQNDFELTITSPFKSDANGAPAIHYALTKKGTKTLIIAVNVIDRPVSMKLSGLSESSYPLEVLFENRRSAIVDGVLRDHFQPYETHVYLSE